MIRLFILLLAFTLCFNANVNAETAISPEQIEAIPFDNSLVAEPNTQPLLEGQSVETQTPAGEVSAEHDSEHKKAGLPQFDVTTFASQIFWLAISFVILYFFFAKKSLPALSSVIEERQARIKEDLNTAESVSKKIEKTKADYEESLQKSHIEAQKFITESTNHLRVEGEKQLEAYKEKSQLAINNVEKEALIAKDKIKNDLETISAQLTQNIVKNITNIEISEADAKKAIASIIKTNDSSNKKAA